MDWLSFLNQHGIEYQTSRHGIAGSNIAIQCPICGSVGRDYHLHISLDGKGWRCWRGYGQGADPSLVQRLLNCTRLQAEEIAGKAPALSHDFLAQVMGRFDQPITTEKLKLCIPKEFKPLVDGPSCRPYRKYLYARGYDDIEKLYDQFGLRYCTRGDFGYRIIFPIHMDKKLVGWTGRTIVPGLEPRYKSLSVDDSPAAVGPINDFLLWYDNIIECDAETIVLCEGPFDALRIRWLAEDYGITATCMFKNKLSSRQIDLLHTLVPKFKRRYVINDYLSEALAQKAASDLRSLKFLPIFLSGRIKDPGGIKNTEQLLKLLPRQ